MKTIAFMCNSTQKRMRESERRAGMSLMEMGYANGYVAISPEHPLWRVHYDNCDISVWGGLTFSDDACCIQEWDNVEMIDNVKQTDIPQDWWVLGFDTMHWGDGPQHNREWVIVETRRMQQQLELFGAMEKLKVFAKTVEESADAQIKEMNDCEAYKDCAVRIMPDCHAGKGCTIGTVIRLNGRVVPNTVGVDIGCGMLVTRLSDKEIDLERLDKVVNEKVPSGFCIHHEKVTDMAQIGMLRCISVIDDDMAQKSIGSLGGGNHFIEVDRGTDGTLYLVIHSGSRNLGVRVCDYYQKRAENHCAANKEQQQAVIARLKAEGRQREIQAELKKLQPLVRNMELAYIEGDDYDDYIHDMQIAQEYAMLNRETIRDIICREMGWQWVEDFHTVHNYIETAMGILRKGAVRASNYEQLIIPMNMRDGSLLCRGKGNPDWLVSAPHGAGRLMSRKKAIDTLSMDEFRQEMSDVYSTSVCPETIDESPMAYKPMQEIIDCIGDTVEVKDIIKPIYNFKAKGR